MSDPDISSDGPVFSDEPVSSDDSAKQWHRTSPLGIIVKALSAAPQLLLALLAVSFGGGQIFSDQGVSGTLLLAGLVLGILSIAAALNFLGWRNRRYRIGSSDIKLEQGILARSARSVPFERIQDVSLEQKLLARLFGLVEVRFETGAGGKDELKLSYVRLERGTALRESVRARIDASEVQENSDAAIGTQPAPETAPKAAADIPLFTMGLRRLVTFGVFEFSLAILAVLAAATQQFDFLIPFKLWNVGDWGERLSGQGAWMLGLGVGVQILGALAGLAGLILVGLVAGIIRTALRDYGFRLEKTPKGFRRRRGLFTRTDVVMPVHRVQAITVSTGFIRRLFGWRGLSFISLAQDAKSANHDVAPFAKMHEIVPISTAAKFALPDDALNWHRPSKAFRIDGAIMMAAIPIIGALVTAYFQLPLVSAGLIIVAGVLAAREYFLWRYECFALSGAQVYSQKGWLSPKLTIAQRPKLHSVEIVQGPIARRRGYCDLRFGLAGGKFDFDGLLLEDAQKLRAEVLASIAEVDFSELAR